MKKTFLFLFALPFMLNAQNIDNQNVVPKFEFSAAFVPLLALSGIQVNQPTIYYDFKIRHNPQTAWRFGVEINSKNYKSSIDNVRVTNDSTLVIDNLYQGTVTGFLRMGVEKQKLLKKNNKIRFRFGIDAIGGTQTYSEFGQFTSYNLKSTSVTRFDNDLTKLTGSKSLLFGISGLVGIDGKITERLHLGVNVTNSAIYLLTKVQSNVDIRMKFIPYLSFAFGD